MENQNQNNYSQANVGTQQAVGTSVQDASLAASGDLSLEQGGSPAVAAVEAPAKKPSLVLRIVKRADILLAALLVIGSIGLFWSVSRSRGDESAANSAVNRFDTTAIPLQDFSVGEGLDFSGQNVTINGSLQTNGALILTPSLQPTDAESGQIYYDQTSNVLAYYNGTEFVTVAGADGVVQSVGGATGEVVLGGGLTVADGTLSNSGVTAVQGQTGAVTLTPGNGITIEGTTISNDGVASITSGSSNIVVNTDTNGNVTISSTAAGTGTVSSPGGTAGTIPVFTGAQTIANSLLNQSGGTITAGGNLAVSGDLTVSGTTNLSTPLSVSSGGTGATSLAVNGVLVGNGTSPITAVTGSPGDCLQLDGGGAPTFSACPGGGAGVDSLNGQTGAVNIANASGAGGTVTIDDASTAQKGIAQFNSSNFSAASGVINTIQDINTGASPTFVDLTLTGDLAVNGGNITSASALTVGTASQALTLQGSAATTFTATDSGNTTTVGFVTPTADVNLNFPALSAGTYEICTSSGNCPAAGTTLQAAYDNSSTPEITLDGTRGALTLQDAATPIGANLFEVQSNGGATTYFAVDASGAVVTGGVDITGTLTSGTANAFQVSASGAVTAVGVDAGTGLIQGTGGLTAGGAITFSGLTNGFLEVDGSGAVSVGTIDLGADTVGDYIANLGALTGLSTTGNTGEGSTPTLSVDYGSTANTAVQGDTQITVAAGTNLTGGGALTLGAGGSVTVNVADSPTFAGNLEVQGGGITAGADGQAGTLALYDGGTGAAAHTGTLQVAGALGQDTVYTLPDPGGATADICLDTGNCAGAGSGITGSGTTNTIPLFTASQNIGDSIITQSGATIDIAGSLTLDNALGVAYGGTGLTTTPANGQLLIGDGSGYSLGTLTNNGGLAITNGSGSIGLAVNYGSVAGTAVQGNTALTCPSGTGNLTGGGNSITLGAGGSCTDLDTVANPTFATSVTTPLVQNAGLTLSATGANDLLLQTNGSTRLTVAGNGDLTATGSLALQGGSLVAGADAQAGTVALYDGGTGAAAHTGTLQVAGTLGQDTTYTLPDPGGATADICLDTGNCAGAGGGITGSGTTNQLSKFTASGTIGDSSISDDGSTVTTSVDMAIQGGGLTVGTASQLGTLTLHDGNGGQTTTLQAGNSGSNLTFVLPTGAGTQFQCLKKGTANQMIWDDCEGGGGGTSGVTSLNGLASDLTLQGTTNQVTVNDNGTDTITLSLPQDIHAAATPTFGGLTLNGALNMSSNDITNAGLINGQTISSAANFTGTVTVGSTLNVNTITPSAAMTVGSTGQALTLQGSDATTITATGGGFTTTVGFDGAPTGDVTYNFDRAASTGTYDVCSTAGNCVGLGDGITGSGTANTVALFTGSQTVGDSIITQSGGTIDIAGSLTLDNALGVAYGGTGLATTPTNGQLLIGNGTGYTLAGLTNDGGLSITNGAGSIGLAVNYGSVAGTAVQGDTALTCPSGTGNLTGGGTSITLGTGGTCAALNTVADPTFATSVTTPLVQNAGLTLSATGVNDLLLQTNGSTRLTIDSAGDLTATGNATLQGGMATLGADSQAGNLLLYDGGTGAAAHTGTLQVAGTLGQDTTYTLPDPGQATADICLDTGNCAGAGGGITGSGTNNTVAKFTGSGTIGDSSITDDGVSVGVGVDLNVTGGIDASGNINASGGALQTGGTSRIDNSGNLVNINNATIGGALTANGNVSLGDAAADTVTANGTIQGGSPLVFEGGTADANELTLSIAALSGDQTITLPDETGTVCLQNSANCGFVAGAAADFIQNQNSSQQAGSNFWISGTGRADTALHAPSFDTAAAAALNIGTTNATSVTFGNATNNTPIALNSGTGTISIGTGGQARTINIGTGAAAQTVTLGSSNTTSATTIQGGGGGLSLLSGANITIGTSDTTGTLLVLDTKTDAGDPTGVNGAMYYNSNSGNFRCFQGGSWVDCITASGGFVSLQNAYDNSTNPEIVLDSTRGALTLRDAATPIGANLFEVQNNAGSSTYFGVTASAVTLGSGMDLIMQGTNAFISNPQGQTNSEAFGMGATLASGSTSAIAIGNSAAANGNNAVIIGTSASGLQDAVVIGNNAESRDGFASAVVVGNSAWADQLGTAIGDASQANFASTALGSGARAIGAWSIAIGEDAQTVGNAQIAIGQGSRTTADSQIVIGSSDTPILDMYLGSGIQAASPAAVSINATDGQGTNIAGAALNIAAGQSTGTAAGGNINLRISGTGSSGTSTNALTTVATLSGSNGAATFQNKANSAAAFRVLNAAGTSTLFNVDTTNGRVEVVDAAFNAQGTVQFSGLGELTGNVYGALCLDNNGVVRQINNPDCTVSSARYKENIETLQKEMGLDAINALNPVTFTYVDGDGRTKVGLVAEEVNEVLPEAVAYDEEGLPKAVNYSMLTANLIKAIQQQQVQIDELHHGVLSGALVEITGHIRVGDDTAGTVTIPAGQTSAAVTFGTPYEFAPKVTTGTSDFVNVIITNKSKTGFTVRIQDSHPTDIKIDWTAFETD